MGCSDGNAATRRGRYGWHREGSCRGRLRCLAERAGISWRNLLRPAAKTADRPSHFAAFLNMAPSVSARVHPCRRHRGYCVRQGQAEGDVESPGGIHLQAFPEPCVNLFTRTFGRRRYADHASVSHDPEETCRGPADPVRDAYDLIVFGCVMFCRSNVEAG